MRPFKCVRQFFFILWQPLLMEKQANVLSEGGSCMSLCICMNFFTLLLIGDNKQAAKSNCGRIKLSASQLCGNLCENFPTNGTVFIS